MQSESWLNWPVGIIGGICILFLFVALITDRAIRDRISRRIQQGRIPKSQNTYHVQNVRTGECYLVGSDRQTIRVEKIDRSLGVLYITIWPKDCHETQGRPLYRGWVGEFTELELPDPARVYSTAWGAAWGAIQRCQQENSRSLKQPF